MLEGGECLANRVQHHIQKIQGGSPHVSIGPTDQTAQFGHLPHLDTRDHSRGEETTDPPLLGLVKICTSMLASQGVLLHSHEVFNRVFCFSCVVTIRSLLFFSIDGVVFIFQ
jgi:hypothetical protein